MPWKGVAVREHKQRISPDTSPNSSSSPAQGAMTNPWRRSACRDRGSRAFRPRCCMIKTAAWSAN